MAEIFWIISETRLVPFAKVESKPRKIKVGRVKEEPPPAFTFINPAIRPTPNKINIEFISDKLISVFLYGLNYRKLYNYFYFKGTY